MSVQNLVNVVNVDKNSNVKKKYVKTGLLVIVCLLISFVTILTCEMEAKAATPLILPDYDVFDATHYAGDSVQLKFHYYPEYTHEIVYVDVYDSQGNHVASSEKQFYNTSYVVDYTVYWDTSDCSAGQYKVVTFIRFYSFNRWNDSPSRHTHYITLSDPSSKPNTGWYIENGKWCYYKYGNKITNEWIADSTGWCYVGADGYMVTNSWIMDSAGWCYIGSNGYCVTNSWVKDSHGWCYLDENGRMATNRWVTDSQGWCYVGADGYCVTNSWVQDSRGWCYLDANGRQVYNSWVRDSHGRCWVDAYGYWDGIYY